MEIIVNKINKITELDFRFKIEGEEKINDFYKDLSFILADRGKYIMTCPILYEFLSCIKMQIAKNL